MMSDSMAPLAPRSAISGPQRQRHASTRLPAGHDLRQIVATNGAAPGAIRRIVASYDMNHVAAVSNSGSWVIEFS
jgi:hypothetical protein